MNRLLIVLMLLLTLTTGAEASEDLDAAEIKMVCAICSMGAYSGDESYLMRTMLTARGCQVEKISHKDNRADAKAYLISRGNVKILTIAGTENLKDVEVDFRVGRVRLNDDGTLGDKKKISSNEIFVHRGFRDYTDVALSDGLAERLITSLKNNPNETLYLTGHSLGGAVATIAAIRLTDAGVPKNQLKVITFGAPAVGSRALANAYEDKIDLTRVVMKGDVIKKSLRTLGYVHFGKVLEYECSYAATKHLEHLMAVYLDRTIHDYLQAGGNFRHEAQDRIAEPIYVAPVFVVKGSLPDSDEEFIYNTLKDSLTNHFSNLIFSGTSSVEVDEKKILDEDFNEYVSAAKNLGCKYVLIRVLSAKKIRDALTGGRRVTLEEFILDDEGLTLSMQTSGASTKKLTIFEAVLYSQENLNNNLKNFFRE